MNSDQFRKALDRVGLNQVGAAKLFDYNDRTIRHWASGKWPVPRIVQIALWLMIKFRVKPEDIPPT